jgi:hypothetical protein
LQGTARKCGFWQFVAASWNKDRLAAACLLAAITGTQRRCSTASRLFLEWKRSKPRRICTELHRFWNADCPQTRMDAHSEHRAVTPGVAGSSPVHSANKINGLALQGANPFSFLGPSGVNQGVNRAAAVRGALRTATNNVTFAVCAHGQGRAVPRSCTEQPGARHASVYLHIDQAQRAHPLREPFPPSGKHVMLAVSGQPFDRVHHRDCRAVGRAIADSVKAYDVLEVRVRAGIHSKVEDDDRQQAFGGKGSTSCDA